MCSVTVLCIISYALLSARVISVQADSSASSEAQEIHRLDQERERYAEEGSQEVKAERKAEAKADEDENDDWYFWGPNGAAAKNRTNEDKDMAAQDFRDARKAEAETQRIKEEFLKEAKAMKKRAAGNAWFLGGLALCIVLVGTSLILGVLRWRSTQETHPLKEGLLNPSEDTGNGRSTHLVKTAQDDEANFKTQLETGIVTTTTTLAEPSEKPTPSQDFTAQASSSSSILRAFISQHLVEPSEKPTPSQDFTAQASSSSPVPPPTNTATPVSQPRRAARGDAVADNAKSDPLASLVAPRRPSREGVTVGLVPSRPVQPSAANRAAGRRASSNRVIDSVLMKQPKSETALPPEEALPSKALPPKAFSGKAPLPRRTSTNKIQPLPSRVPPGNRS